MSREVISVASLAQARDGLLRVDPTAVVTPLAEDEARTQGIRIVRGSRPVPTDAASPATDLSLAAQVRCIVESLLPPGGTEVLAGRQRRPGVKLCREQDAALADFPFPGPEPGHRVQAVDVVTSDDGPLAAGYMTLTDGSFPWALDYDEVQIVLEGELHIGGPEGERVGRPGDILYVPKGSDITFGTSSWAKFVYVTFPSNWAAGRP